MSKSTTNTAAYQLGRAGIDVPDSALEDLPPGLSLEDMVLVSALLINSEEMADKARGEYLGDDNE